MSLFCPAYLDTVDLVSVLPRVFVKEEGGTGGLI